MTLTNALLLACAALSAIAVVLLVLLLFRRKRDALRKDDEAQRLGASILLLEEKLRGASVLTADHLLPIAGGLEQIRAEVAGVSRIVESLAARSASSANDPVALEHQVLAESWKQFQSDRERSSALEDALQDRAWGELLDALTNAIPNDLKPTFDAVVVPCREHRTFMNRIDLIPRMVSGQFPRLPTDAEEVRRTRELAGLLTSDAASRLDFRFRSWVTDAFLPFADLYLQRYEQARLEQRDDELRPGLNLVRQVLGIAAVEPIDVVPGETAFDSTRHIGRSTSNDPRFADGVITGVVRNGFVEGGAQVIRQPEVIVNRMR